MSEPSVLFVCLGNICRSPLAEAAFRAQAERVRLAAGADSAGTGDWHVGSPPDPRAQAVALRHGIDISGYRGRQVRAEDFHRFSHIFALDGTNLRDLRGIRPADGTAHLALLMDLVPGREGTNVTDPYFGDAAGFDVTWRDVTLAAAALAEKLSGR
ncbi:protein-tyrosine phosphatase [Sphingobium faniae]|nr:protein-tyrosine phosphatase [Sphingobium faniae]